MIFEFLQDGDRREMVGQPAPVCEHSHCVPGMFILKGELARSVTEVRWRGGGARKRQAGIN